MKKLALGLALFLACSTAHAATYYIDLDAGSDAAAGTIGAPFLSCSPLEGVGALTGNDIVYIKSGTVSEEVTGVCQFRSTGTSGNYISVDEYDSGTAPTFWGNAPYTAGWTLDSGNVYRTTASITWSNVGAVSVDDSTALWSSTTRAGMAAESYYFNSATDILYVWLSDGTTPSDNTIRIARWNYGSNPASWGAFSFYGGGGGNYIRVSNIIWNLANEIFAFRAAGSYNEFTNCTSNFNSREGFHFGKNGTSPSTGATNGKMTNCTAKWNNGKGTGFGQGVTTEAPYFVIIDSTMEYNGMAGLDFLDFNTNTDVHSGVAARNVLSSNGRARFLTFADPNIYIDGANNITLIQNDIELAGDGTHAATIFGDNIRLNNEHPELGIVVTGINIVNNLSYNASGTALRIDIDDSGYSIEGTRIIGNTMIRGGGSAFRTIQPSDLGTSGLTYFYNNAVNCVASSPCIRDLSTASRPYWKSDFNIMYTPSNSNWMQSNATNYSLSGWQALESEDANSLDQDILFVDASTTDPNVRLQSISEGYGANSAAINLADETQWDATTMATYAPWTIIEGTTRVDEAVDSSSSLDAGYHYFVSDPPDPAPPLELTSTNVEPGSIVRSTVSTVTISFTTQTAIPADGKIIVTFPSSLGAGYVLNSGGTGAAGGLSGLDGTLTVGVVGNVATFTRGGGATSSSAGAKSFTYTFVKNPDVAGSTGTYSIQTTDTNSLVLDQDTAVTADTITDPPVNTVTFTITGGTLTGYIS